MMKNRTCHDSLAPFARTAVKVATSLALIGALAGCAATNGGETVDSLMRLDLPAGVDIEIKL